MWLVTGVDTTDIIFLLWWNNTTVSHAFRQCFEKCLGVGQTQARIGNRLAVHQRSVSNIMLAFHQIRFNHYAFDTSASTHNLVGNRRTHNELIRVLFLGVAMRHVDENVGGQLLRLQLVFGLLHVNRAVIWPICASAQNNVAVRVTGRFDGGDLPVLVAPEETLGVRRRLDGVNGDVDAPSGAVLETDGCRNA